MANEQLKTLTIGNTSFDPNIAFLGIDPTNGAEANDTKELWETLGTGWAYIGGAGQVHGQPTTNGIIKSFVCKNTETTTIIFQVWHSTSNTIYSRYGSSTTVDMPEWTRYAPTESPTFTGTPKAPTNTTYTTNNTQIATTAFVQNAINRRLPKSTNATANQATTVAVATGVTGKTWNVWTAPAKGIIIASCSITFSANATGYRGLEVEVNGAGTGVALQVMSPTTGNCALTVPLARHLNADDKVQFIGRQNSGANLNCIARRLNGIFIAD